METCLICHEPVSKIQGVWVHNHSGDAYCHTGDGSTAMPTYNGYANEDSYLFDVVWSNSQPLYEAIKSHAKAMRPRQEVMTYQTLGRNMKDAIRAMVSDGGYGWRSCPDEFVSVRTESIRLLEGINLDNINEEEFGENIRHALEVDDG